MRPSQEDKLAEARRHFYCYQFRPAYHLYHQAFSTLPFHLSPAHLEHLSHYARTLLELDRLEELRFYLPILERHYERAGGAHPGYALAYIHYLLGSKGRAKQLFEAVARTGGDLRIKAVMMLARLSNDETECIRLIRSLEEPARDPHLAQLLEVWNCIVLRYQGRLGDSIQGLKRLISGLDSGADWYSLLAARDALTRGHLHRLDFESARSEIEGIGAGTEWGKLRTVAMQISQLNTLYREQLALRTIVAVERETALELTHGPHGARVRHPGLRRLFHLFHERPTLTLKRAARSLSASQSEMREILRRFTGKLQQLRLPKDSLDYQGARLVLVPGLRVDKEGWL